MDIRLEKYLAEAQNMLNSTSTVGIPTVDIICATYRTSQIVNLFQKINAQQVRIGRAVFCVQGYNARQIALLRNNVKAQDVIIFEADKTDSLGERHNLMMEHTTADYVAIMDDDDLYFPNYLKQQMAYLVNKSADATSIANPIGHTIPNETYGFLFRIYRTGDDHPGAGGSVVFSRKAYDRVGGFTDVPEGYDNDFLRSVINDATLKHVETPPFNFAVTRSLLGDNTWKMSPSIEGDYKLNVVSKADIIL